MTAASRPVLNEWTVRIPMPYTSGRVPVGWLTLNQRIHRLHAARIAREWRTASCWALKAAGIPRLERAEVQVVIQAMTRRIRDPGNFEPTIKPIIDAFGTYEPRLSRTRNQWIAPIGCGILAGDDPRYLVKPETVFGPILGTKSPTAGQVTLHIRRLPALEPLVEENSPSPFPDAEVSNFHA